MRRMFGVLLLAGFFPGVAGGGAGGSICDGFDIGSTVRMLDSCFAGTAHFAAADAPIVIDNQGEFPHTFTAVDGSFDTGQISAGSSAVLTIDEPGVYQVFCTLHGTAKGQGMAGALIVGDAAASGSVAIQPSASQGPVQSTGGSLLTMVTAFGVAGVVSLLALRATRRRTRRTAAVAER